MSDGTARGRDPDPAAVTDRVELAAALTELREAAGLSVRELARRIDVPVGTVGGYLTGRHLPGPAQHSVVAALLHECGVTDDAEVDAWMAALRRIRQAPGPRAGDQRPPYPGLAAFEPGDAPFFFGREDLTTEVLALIERARVPERAGGLVTVVGASGSGKSSLLRAGVLPAARAGGDCPVVLVPGEDPVAALRAAVAEQLAAADATVLDSALSGVPDSRPESSARLLLVVDQAEELFTVCAAGPRREFLDLLHALTAVTDARGRRAVVSVLALRGDQYPVAAAQPDLLPALREAQVLVGSMTAGELASAITGPAGVVGVHVDDGLVRMLLDDVAPRDAPVVAHDRGALPLLAHALRETWQGSRRGRMTVADYLATGGISGAVERTAEAVWAELDDTGRELARRVLLRLVLVADDAAVTRRRVRIDELLDLPAEDGAGGRVREVIDRFVRARLLTTHRGTVEISHEALLRAWSRLHDWVDADRSGLRAHRQLAETAQAWKDGGRDRSYLLRGNRLAAAEEWIERGHLTLNHLERDFLQASQDDRARTLDDERRRRRRLRQALVAVAVLALVASGLAVFGFRASSAANTRAVEAATARDQAQSRELAIAADRLRATDPALAAQLSLVAYRTSPTVDARSALLDSTASPLPTRIPAQDGPTSIALDPTGTVLAVTNAEDGSVSLWLLTDPLAPHRIATLPSAQPDRQEFSAAISPDGQHLAVGNEDGLIQRWDISDPQHPVSLTGPGKVFPTGVLTLAYSPDGRTLVAGGAGDAVQRWNLTDPTRPRTLPSLPASAVTGAVTISPDGSTLWTGGSDGVLRIWTRPGGSTVPPPSTGTDGATAPTELHAGSSQVNAIAIDPDGTLVATGDKAGQVALWRVDHAGSATRLDQSFAGLTGWVSTLAFSPDGRMLAIGTTGNQVRIVATADWSTVLSVDSPGPVTSVAFDGSGTLLAAATDGYVRAWPVPGPVIGPVGTAVFGVARTADGHLYVTTGSAVNKLLSFGVRDRQHAVRGPSAAPADGIALDGSFAVTDDGRLAAIGAADGRVQLWNIADRAHPVALGAPLAVSDDLVEQLAFSPDGHIMAVGANDQRVRIWDVTDPDAPRELASTVSTGGQVYSVAFQPGGTLLAGATTAGTVWIWDIADPRHPRKVAELSGMDGYALSTAFSPDGTVLAAAGAGRAVHLWDMADPAHPAPIGTPLTGPTNNINMIGYAPDGSRLAAVTSDGMVWVWDVRRPSEPALLSHLHAASGVLYAMAWSPDSTALSAGGSAQRVRSWITDPTAAAAEICRTQGTPITRDEWALYVQGRAYQPPCD